MSEEKGEILIYSSDDGVTKIDVRLEDETVWLTQQLADLYHTSKSNVSEHITNGIVLPSFVIIFLISKYLERFF